ncbi:hypothetical protein DQ04_13891030, partial [Trypanosoma grayi]|uniref:hypothetical protein n=1 Tax=Trypanosoma grayi TaxID=71804 RepID=UPI0004F488CE
GGGGKAIPSAVQRHGRGLEVAHFPSRLCCVAPFSGITVFVVTRSGGCFSAGVAPNFRCRCSFAAGKGCFAVCPLNLPGLGSFRFLLWREKTSGKRLRRIARPLDKNADGPNKADVPLKRI